MIKRIKFYIRQYFFGLYVDDRITERTWLRVRGWMQ